MAYKKYASIRVRPVIFEKDTNGDFILDTNNDKIILVQPNNVNSTEPYDYLVEIEEFE
jgi:hypothetical protein